VELEDDDVRNRAEEVGPVLDERAAEQVRHQELRSCRGEIDLAMLAAISRWADSACPAAMRIVPTSILAIPRLPTAPLAISASAIAWGSPSPSRRAASG